MDLTPRDARTLAALLFDTHPKVVELVAESGAPHRGPAAVLEFRAILWAENRGGLRQECSERARDVIAAFGRHSLRPGQITHPGY